MKPPLTAEELRFRDGNSNIPGWQNECFKICFLLLPKMFSENRCFAVCLLTRGHVTTVKFRKTYLELTKATAKYF